jgi:hypothetical protein
MHLLRRADAFDRLDVYQQEPAGDRGRSSEAHPPAQGQTNAGEDRELGDADALELLRAVLSRKLREFVE